MNYDKYGHFRTRVVSFFPLIPQIFADGQNMICADQRDLRETKKFELE